MDGLHRGDVLQPAAVVVLPSIVRPVPCRRDERDCRREVPQQRSPRLARRDLRSRRPGERKPRAPRCEVRAVILLLYKTKHFWGKNLEFPIQKKNNLYLNGVAGDLQQLVRGGQIDHLPAAPAVWTHSPARGAVCERLRSPRLDASPRSARSGNPRPPPDQASSRHCRWRPRRRSCRRATAASGSRRRWPACVATPGASQRAARRRPALERGRRPARCRPTAWCMPSARCKQHPRLDRKIWRQPPSG